MKIGLLTIQKSPSSYGANLQCYALWKYLNHMENVSCDVLDLLRPCHFGYKNPSCVVMNDILLDNKKIAEKQTIKSFVKKLLLKNMIKGNKRTIDFHALCSYSSRLNIDELYKKTLDYDVFMAGSDQLWNPTQVYPVEPFFLTFTNKKKISYASSIGLNIIPEKSKVYFNKWLSNFDFISVREKNAATMLATELEREVCVVVDPTLLLSKDDWLNLIEQNSSLQEKNGYILIYSLYYSDEVRNFCDNLMKNSSKRIIVLDGAYKSKGNIKNITNVGPFEFLYLISNADYVYTDSFHCSLFSILFDVPFYTMIDNCNRDRLSRLQDLLEMSSCVDTRMFEIRDLYGKQLNLSTVDKTELLKKIEFSKKYLNEAIYGK